MTEIIPLPSPTRARLPLFSSLLFSLLTQMAEGGLVQLDPGTQVMPTRYLSQSFFSNSNVSRLGRVRTQVDRWTIIKKLGEGGFGAVYKVFSEYYSLRNISRIFDYRTPIRRRSPGKAESMH